LEKERMSESITPFDHRPDPVLGSALRAALAPGDRAAFVARVRAAMERRPDPLMDVLARWARLGIAAALLVALGAGVLVARGAAPEIVSIASDAGAVLAGVEGPDAAGLIASFPDP
jgi:hypothetical protein